MSAAAAPCNLGTGLLPAQTTVAQLSIGAGVLSLSILYNFALTVSSVDGRSSRQVVAVTTWLAGSPVVYSANTLTKFSADQKVS